MAVDKGFSSKIKTKTPAWYQGGSAYRGKDKARGTGATTPTAPTTGWTEAAKKAYGGRYGKQETGAYYDPTTGEISTPASRFQGTLGQISGASSFMAAVPAQANAERFNRAVAAAPRVPAQMIGPSSFMGAGGGVVRGMGGWGGRPIDLAQREEQMQNMADAVQRRKDFFADYGYPADYDVGNIELGNWIGDYIRSLYTVPPPTAEPPTGGPTWWGGRGGGRGYGAGYNPYTPAWYTGLFQLNANR